MQPALGRFFDESEDVRDGAALAVISYGAWQREYGGDRPVLGRTIDFGHGPFAIIGVAPSGFTGALRSWTLGATLFSVFGLLALVVAAVGLYSVLSFDVAQRTREIGLRSALGATPGSVVRLFIMRALWLTAAGTAAGLLAAVVLTTRIEHLLFETTPRDPATFAGVALTRGQGIGTDLLRECLQAMWNEGYAYAVIGWADDEAVAFYRDVAGATVIADSFPGIYKRMISM